MKRVLYLLKGMPAVGKARSLREQNDDSARTPTNCLIYRFLDNMYK